MLARETTNVSLLKELETCWADAVYKHIAPSGAGIVLGARGYKHFAPKRARTGFAMRICNIPLLPVYKHVAPTELGSCWGISVYKHFAPMELESC